jgi:hypothetical protein
MILASMLSPKWAMDQDLPNAGAACVAVMSGPLHRAASSEHDHDVVAQM